MATYVDLMIATVVITLLTILVFSGSTIINVSCCRTAKPQTGVRSCNISQEWDH